ncbi:MAG TPA: hypothetical protein VJ826_16165, partial [Candidatus Polarisedimenticolaceae bacterium]|nr:hypothetical protein [Candidatus Polarisedimenticolaceae bacterium]
MRILGATVRELTPSGGRGALAALDADGRIATLAAIDGLPSLTREAARLAAGEPFLLAADIAIVQSSGKSRRVDGWVHRRLGVRLAAARASALQGSELVAALAAAGQPALPYPDRDRRRTGLVEIHPELVLKALLWESSAAASSPSLPDREEVLRALDVPVYRGAKLAKASWADRFALLDRAMHAVAGAEIDHGALYSELTKAVTVDAVDRTAAAFDATLLASTARRYIEEPERCAFVGDRESGYTVVPADAFLRRVVLREPAGANRTALFPKASIKDRLQSHADVRALELLGLPGRAQHFEAVFRQAPLLEFDNVDEMLWWKHTRHLDGPEIPSEGLREMVVKLEAPAHSDGPLRLTR